MYPKSVEFFDNIMQFASEERGVWLCSFHIMDDSRKKVYL